MSRAAVYLNGEWRTRDDAAVSVDDRGLLQGVGLFETMRARNGRVWRIDRHLARMRASAEALSLPLPPDFGAIPDVAAELLSRAGLRDAKVRFTITAGLPGADAEGPNRPTSLLTAASFVPYPEVQYDRGMTVLISSCRQSRADPVAGHKSLSYLPRLVALQTAHRAGCQEALWFTPDHRLAEGCVSNVFVVRDGRLRTPPLNTPVLPGITRAAVLELAADCSLEAAEEALTIDDLLDADEVILTNVGLGVMPVCRVERSAIGTERPGPAAGCLRGVLAELIARETDAPETH